MGRMSAEAFLYIVEQSEVRRSLFSGDGGGEKEAFHD